MLTFRLGKTRIGEKKGAVVLPITMDELIMRLLQLVPQCAALLILTVAAWFLLRLLREDLSKTELRPADYLKSFQKLREEGNLTDEEFRIIRKMVSLQISRNPEEPQPDYSLLNKNAPPQPVDRPSGNFPKN